MSSPSKSADKGAVDPERTRQRQPRLNPMMACDTAFRVVARRYLEDLTAHREATCRGDPTALHQMRIALTHLRAAISFFSPMLDDAKRTQVRHELKWLNTRLGAVRDLDVAIERLKPTTKKPQQKSKLHDRSWDDERADGHRKLARALRSVRFRRLAKATSDWIESGPWSIKQGKPAAERRADPIAAYSLRKLTQWQDRLLKKSRKLMKMDVKKRHRLRLMNKRLCYSIEAMSDLAAEKGFSRHEEALKHLRKAQKSLGQLNDDARGRSLANSVRAPVQLLGRKREKRLMRTAVEAYRNLAALKPFRDQRRTYSPGASGRL